MTRQVLFVQEESAVFSLAELGLREPDLAVPGVGQRLVAQVEWVDHSEGNVKSLFRCENVRVIEVVFLDRRGDVHAFLANEDIEFVAGVHYEHDKEQNGAASAHARLHHISVSVQALFEHLPEFVLLDQLAYESAIFTFFDTLLHF